MARLKTAVLISGRGSNLQALLDAAANPDYPAEIVVVVSNRPDAQGLERARRAGVAAAIVAHRDFASRESFEAALDDTLRRHGAEFVCLAGFMRLLTAGFVERWRDRLINIHPSLLPLYKGLDTHARVLAAGDSETGCTIHFVRPDMDAGPTILQQRVPVRPGDTEDTLAARVLEAEHDAYPRVLRAVAEGRVHVDGDRVTVSGDL